MYAQQLDDHLPELALHHHFGRSANLKKGFDYRAGEQAHVDSAYLEAVQNFTRAMELLGCCPKNAA